MTWSLARPILPLRSFVSLAVDDWFKVLKEAAKAGPVELVKEVKAAHGGSPGALCRARGR